MTRRVEDDLTREDVVQWVQAFTASQRYHPWASLKIETDGSGFFWITEDIADLDWSE